MNCVSSSGNVAEGSSKTIIAVKNTAAKKALVKAVLFSCSSTPEDKSARFAVRRFTADGTGTAGAGYSTDDSAVASTCTIKVNYTVEPTYESGNPIEINVNMRNTYLWTPPAGFEMGQPYGTANGTAVQMISGPGTSENWNVTIFWTE